MRKKRHLPRTQLRHIAQILNYNTNFNYNLDIVGLGEENQSNLLEEIVSLSDDEGQRQILEDFFGMSGIADPVRKYAEIHRKSVAWASAFMNDERSSFVNDNAVEIRDLFEQYFALYGGRK